MICGVTPRVLQPRRSERGIGTNVMGYKGQGEMNDIGEKNLAMSGGEWSSSLPI